MTAWLLAGVLLGAAPMMAQSGLDGFGQANATPARNHQYVEYAAESETIAAGRPAVLELRFHVREGFHVNSHAPKSELLTPTALSFRPDASVKLAASLDYPAGKPYSLGADSGDPLDVYTDSFIVRVPITATAGTHQLEGELLYQACDRAACYPPRKLPVTVIFTAK